MGFKYSFVDSVIYGTEDINDITRSLVGAGIAPFLGKDSYNALDLNSLTSALVETGPSLGGCKCSVEDTGTDKMTVRVEQGIVFFESGVRLEVDEDGYSVSVTPNTAGYVYAHYSPSLQKADIVFSAEIPSDGEYVILARLGEDGGLKDERIFARSKIATFGNNAVYSIPESRVTICNSYDTAPEYSSNGEIILAEIDLKGIDISKFNYLIYRYTGWNSDQVVTEKFERQFDFKNNTEIGFYISGTGYYHDMFKIILDSDRFLFIEKKYQEKAHNSLVYDFKSAIPYFKLV